MHRITIKALAKINLSLHIVGKRDDGYHELSGVMHTIDLWDEVTIEKTSSEGVFLSTDHSKLSTDETNTAYKAAMLMKKALGTVGGYRIDIEKNIPVEAGLGGSSADAAAVMNGINILEGSAYQKRELSAMGTSIGADVPFMIHGGCAHCSGIGEIIRLQKPIEGASLIIVKPPLGVSTKWAFDEYDRQRIKNTADNGELIGALKSGNIQNISKCLHNDLEDVVIKAFPVIRRIKEKLLEFGALGSLMSGSGSGVYGVFDNEELAERAYKKIKEYDSWKSAIVGLVKGGYEQC